MNGSLAVDPRTWAAREQGSALLWLALAIVLVTRLAAVLGLPVEQSSDMSWYHARALELLDRGSYSENGVPTAYWPVGYPAFLAGVLALGGRSVLVGQLANVALSLLCVVLLYRWSLARFASARVAGVAALLLALYPNHVGYSVGLYSEPLFTAMLLGICLLARPDAGAARIAAAGLLAGLATLVKAQTMLLGPVLLLVLCWGGWSLASLRGAIGRAALATLVMVAVLAPWTYRNAVVMGKAVPVSTNGGMSLLAGNNPAMTTSLGNDYNDDSDLVRSVRFSVADQVAADARAKAAAWQWIRDNPGTFVALMPKKLFRLWASDGESEWVFQSGYKAYETQRLWFRGVRVVNQLFYFALLAGCAWAWWRMRRPEQPAALAVPMMVAFFSLLCMVFSGQSRYHAPLMPFIAAYAAWTWVAWRQRGPAASARADR
jgi:hypothetical protein